MSAIRIFRWADAPEEYRVVEKRQWLAFVPDGREFDARSDVGWADLVMAYVEGGCVIAGNEKA